MREIKLGLIPSPDLPAKLTSTFVDDLPKFLSSRVDDSVTWKPYNISDPLIGSAEYMNQLMNKAVDLKHKNKWDYVICLTDLPQFMDRHVIMADVDTTNKVALVSIPSFGSFPMKRRIKWAISKILNDMHHMDKINTSRIYRKSTKDRPLFYPLQRITLRHDDTEQSETEPVTEADHNQHTIKHKHQPQDTPNKKDIDTTQNEATSKDQETQEETTESDIRYIIKSKLFGYLCILAGMTFANRPWTALISFKKVLMLAFGTGIYITLFPTPWELSTIYSIPRFILLMFVAISGMVTWMVFAHNLWEKPTQKGDIRLRKLYNYTTLTTLSLIMLINYIVLYCLFFAAIAIFVPPGLFEAATNLNHDPSIKHYFLLTWLITSLGTLAGSIGTASEREEDIRRITYSYRQINRYYEIQDTSDTDGTKQANKEQSKQYNRT